MTSEPRTLKSQRLKRHRFKPSFQ